MAKKRKKKVLSARICFKIILQMLQYFRKYLLHLKTVFFLKKNFFFFKHHKLITSPNCGGEASL